MYKLPVYDPNNAVYHGRPVTEEMQQMFSPWGKVKGIMVAGADRPILVQFEGGYQIDFIPVTGGA